MDLGMGEILLVLLVALLVYGGRLPEVARSLGKSLATLKRSLQDATDGVTREARAAIDLTGDLDDERPRTVRRVPTPPDAAPHVAPDVSQPAAPAPAPADVPVAEGGADGRSGPTAGGGEEARPEP